MRLRVQSGSIWVAVIAIFFLVGPLLAFGIPEYLAMTDPEGLTLSQFSYTLFSRNMALLFWVAFMMGALLGGTSVHLFWHWVPKEKRTICGQCQKTILLPDH